MKPYYEHAGVTIFCGDCREIIPQLGLFDMICTDPPYGIGFAAQPTNYQRAAGHKPEIWDDAAFIGLGDILHCADVQIVWGGNYYELPRSRGWLAWCKPDAPPSMGSVELAWTNQDRNCRYLIHSIAATNAERVGHPTQKPMAVMRWCLAQFPDVATLCDPFCGSGTTLVAGKLLGIPAVGIEINERYCELAAQRLSQEVLNFS